MAKAQVDPAGIRTWDDLLAATGVSRTRHCEQHWGHSNPTFLPRLPDGAELVLNDFLKTHFA
jgi:hypothetical protein